MESRKTNLFCLPFAGGSVYSYRNYQKVAPNGINIIPIELPGRGKRFNELALGDIHQMVDDIMCQFRRKFADQPYALYGHSLGTLLGYLLTKRIISEQLNLPRYLFVTGRAAPIIPLKEPPRYLLSRDAFFQRMEELGGTPADVLADGTIRDIFEPVLRADFKAVETYAYQSTKPFDVPIHVMIGTEETVTTQEALAWQMETTHPIELTKFPGKHFFIFSFGQQIMTLIENKLSTVNPY